MARIRCINSKCTAPDRIFEVYEDDYLEPEGQFVKLGTPGAVDIIVRCTECGAENKVKGTKPKRNTTGARGPTVE